MATVFLLTSVDSSNNYEFDDTLYSGSVFTTRELAQAAAQDWVDEDWESQEGKESPKLEWQMHDTGDEWFAEQDPCVFLVREVKLDP